MTWRDRWPSLAASVSEAPPDGCGVYFLVQDGQIVYVGSSVYPSRRVWSHTYDPTKKFSESFFLAVEQSRMLDAERYWIVTIKPIYNRQHNPDFAKEKSENARIACSIMSKVRVIAAFLGNSVPTYLNQTLDAVIDKEYGEIVERMVREVADS